VPTRSMFEIRSSGVRKPKLRLVSDRVLTKADFKKIAKAVGEQPFSAQKIAFIAARAARRTEAVETYWNGKETRNTAKPGDLIVTSLTRRKTVLRDKAGNPNTYVIKEKSFARLYAPVRGKNRMGRFYRAKSIVSAIPLSGGFDILAPWGERERAPKGYLLLNGKEVYGNNAGTFTATYESVDPPKPRGRRRAAK
jgi:hypothetical protein